MNDRSTNTMAESLKKMLTDLAGAKLAADADLPFIIQLETQIVDKLRDPNTQAAAAGFPGAGQPGQPPGGPGPAAQGPPPGGPSFQGAGMPGLMQSPGAPNADELGRLLSQGHQ